MVVSVQHRQILVGVVARECRREVEEEQEEVTIVCQDGQEVYTNRALLSLLSPLLRPMLSSSSTLFLPDHSKATLLALLHLLRGEWRGEVRVSREVATLATTLAINMPLVQAENRQQEIPVLTLDEEEDSSVKDIDAEIDAEIEAVDGELETNMRKGKISTDIETDSEVATAREPSGELQKSKTITNCFPDYEHETVVSPLEIYEEMDPKQSGEIETEIVVKAKCDTENKESDEKDISESIIKCINCDKVWKEGPDLNKSIKNHLLAMHSGEDFAIYLDSGFENNKCKECKWSKTGKSAQIRHMFYSHGVLKSEILKTLAMIKSSKFKKTSPKKRKADENEHEYPVKRVRVLLKNVKAPFEYTDQQVAQTETLEQNEPNNSGPETETESNGSEPRSSPAGCKVCEKTFQNEERLLRHYCHKHFGSQLTSLVQDYFDGHTCKVCGLQFLQQNAINLRSHIGIDHQRLDEFIENISVHSENSAQTQNINIEEVSEKTSDATRNDEETTAEMNLEEIQKYLLSYQSNDEEESEKLLAEDGIDDEIMELELPTKPAAPFIDLVFEEDEHDTKLMEIIDDTLQRMDTEV